MKIYTSYFAKLGMLLQQGIVPICIARGIPRFYNGAVDHSVAPYGWMLSGKISREEYIDAYLHKVLDGIDPNN